MLLIYVPKLTNRIGYTLNVIFKYLLRADFNITTDAGCYLAHDGAKLCYGQKPLDGGIYLKAAELLFATSIEEQSPHPFQRDGQWMLYPVYGRQAALPFDPLAATFFMVSRYEEYMPHRQDEHGRFMHEESIAAQAGFMEEPVVEQWAAMVRNVLIERYPDLKLTRRSYRFLQTVDIEEPWRYLHKGVFRTAAGLARDLFARRDMEEVSRRFRVLAHKEPDPYDNFEYIINQSARVPESHLIFFALLADYGPYDKAAAYMNPEVRQMLQHLDDYAHMGVLCGHDTLEKPAWFDEETRRLDAILHRVIIRSRFHHIRLQLPQSYRILLHSSIRQDYTMGYTDATGFRAGISRHYPFYDLERDMETELMVYPFCVVDTTLKDVLNLTPDEAVAKYRKLVDSVRKVDGCFCCIVHNQALGERYGWQGWRQVYEQMLDYAKP